MGEVVSLSRLREPTHDEVRACVASNVRDVLRMFPRRGNWDGDDLYQEGWIGYLEASPRWQRGWLRAKKLTFCEPRIRGRMIDFVREQIGDGRAKARPELVDVESVVLASSEESPETVVAMREIGVWAVGQIARMPERVREAAERGIIEGASLDRPQMELRNRARGLLRRAWYAQPMRAELGLRVGCR